MTYSKVAVLILVTGAVAFASGRYSVSVDKTTTTVTSTDVSRDKEVHKETRIERQGDKEVTTIVESTRISTDISKNSKRDTVEVAQKKPLNVSLLAGLDTTDNLTPIYGLSVSKEVLGPITVGAWGFNNGTLGISLGVNF